MSDMKYLTSKSIAHIWWGEDTQCRMYSTGGLKKSKYRVNDSSLDLPICTMCRVTYNLTNKKPLDTSPSAKSDITIPPEAVEAAARAICAGNQCGAPCVTPCSECLPDARAALEAALKAWPGMHVHDWQRPWLGGMSGTDLILPLKETK